MDAEIKQSELILLEAMPLALVIFELDGRTVWVSERGRKLLGSCDDLASALDTFTSDTRFDDWHKALKVVFESNGPLRFAHINCHDPIGKSKIIDLTVWRVGSEDGRSNRAVALLEDTTAISDMDRKLAHSERLAALGKFSAELAHELNNPLDGILRYVNLAIRLCEPLEDNRPSEYLMQARRGLMRMIRLVTELLEFSRTSDAALVEDRIDHIVDEALNSLEGRARESGVSFRRRFATNLPFVRSGNLCQVFSNIIRNAIEAMAQGGELITTAEIIDDEVRITFSDEGHGFGEGGAERAFEPFFTTKPAGEGTGLGLAICREVIEKYRGTVSGADRAEGGAVMTVTIPLNNCQTAANMYLPRSSRQTRGD